MGRDAPLRVARIERDDFRAESLETSWHGKEETALRLDLDHRPDRLNHFTGGIIDEGRLHCRYQIRDPEVPSDVVLVQIKCHAKRSFPENSLCTHRTR